MLVAYRGKKYIKLSDHVVYYDEEEIRDGEGERYRRGISFRTKNIASFVALGSTDRQGKGLIVATTHLFWHPRYTYERTRSAPPLLLIPALSGQLISPGRQVVILLREVTKFHNTINPNWPCIIAGGTFITVLHVTSADDKLLDFNFTPEDPGYSLLVGDPITSSQEGLLSLSHVVHASIDPDGVPTTEPKEIKNEEDDGAEQDPDRIIVNARAATPSDGLLSTEELVETVLQLGVVRPESSYDKGLAVAKISGSFNIPTFGDRVTSIPSARKGRHEPEWTSYTYFWKTVLGELAFLKTLVCYWSSYP